MCETSCVWFAQARCTGLHNKDIFLCLRIISGCLQKKLPQISNRKYGGSCCNTKHHGRHSGPACTAGALYGPHRKSLIVIEEKEKLSTHWITISNSFPRSEDICMAKFSLPVQGKGVVMENVWRRLKHLSMKFFYHSVCRVSAVSLFCLLSF